jgi:hypothetical protein
MVEFIEEITGDYTGTLTALGASHEPRSHVHLVVAVVYARSIDKRYVDMQLISYL